MRISLLLLITILMCLPAQAQEPPAAVDDSFYTNTDSTLTVASPGVLENDYSDVEIEAVLVEPPSNGMLSLAPDGSFVYTPNPGFSGIDTFTYVAQTVGAPEEFAVDPLQSNVVMTASVSTIIGSREDNDSSTLGGAVTAEVVPNTEPFAEMQLLSMDLALSDPMSFRFDFGILVGAIDVTTDSDSLVLVLQPPPGPVASVTDGSFTQVGNMLGMTGRLDVSASGALSNLSGPQHLDVSTAWDVNGTIGQNNSDLTLSFPLNAQGSFDVSGNNVDVSLQGTVVATGSVVVTLASEPATVTLVVTEAVGTEEADGLDPAFALGQNFPNPAGKVTSVDYVLPAVSVVRLDVFDALGRRVSTPVDGVQSEGTHHARVDVSRLPVGIYFYRLEAGPSVDMKKMIVVR